MFVTWVSGKRRGGKMASTRVLKPELVLSLTRRLTGSTLALVGTPLWRKRALLSVTQWKSPSTRKRSSKNCDSLRGSWVKLYSTDGPCGTVRSSSQQTLLHRGCSDESSRPASEKKS